MLDQLKYFIVIVQAGPTNKHVLSYFPNFVQTFSRDLKHTGQDSQRSSPAFFLVVFMSYGQKHHHRPDGFSFGCNWAKQANSSGTVVECLGE